jgi:hypothetical protein
MQADLRVCTDAIIALDLSPEEGFEKAYQEAKRAWLASEKTSEKLIQHMGFHGCHLT